MTIIEAFIAEHAIFCSVFDQIDGSLPSIRSLAEVKHLTSLVQGLLSRHAAAEEDWVFSALDHLLEHKTQRDCFFQEHRELNAFLREAETAQELSEGRESLSLALRFSRDHFWREEQRIFPLAVQEMSNETLTELGHAWLCQRTNRLVQSGEDQQ